MFKSCDCCAYVELESGPLEAKLAVIKDHTLDVFYEKVTPFREKKRLEEEKYAERLKNAWFPKLYRHFTGGRPAYTRLNWLERSPYYFDVINFVFKKDRVLEVVDPLLVAARAGKTVYVPAEDVQKVEKWYRQAQKAIREKKT